MMHWHTGGSLHPYQEVCFRQVSMYLPQKKWRDKNSNIIEHFPYMGM